MEKLKINANTDTARKSKPRWCLFLLVIFLFVLVTAHVVLKGQKYSVVAKMFAKAHLGSFVVSGLQSNGPDGHLLSYCLPQPYY